MPEKEIEKLQAEKEKVERQLAQEQHKIQRLENRAPTMKRENGASGYSTSISSTTGWALSLWMN